MDPPEVEPIFGPMIVGVFINTFLCGVLVVQIFIYYQTYKKDPTWMRYFIWYLLILELANTGLDFYAVYEPLVKLNGKVEAVTFVPMMLAADPLLTAMAAFSVQSFIAWRIRILSGSRVLTGIIVFFALSSLAGGIAIAICVIVFPEFSRFESFKGAVITWLASSTAADIIITASLVWSLNRRKTGMTDSDDIINRIIRFTVQTGLLTSVLAVVGLISFLSTPITIFFTMTMALSKIYSNSLLSTLNARAGWDHLTGKANQPNILFGDSSNKPNSHRTVPIGFDNRDEPNAAYELGRRHSTEGFAVKNGVDLERGVSVTTVVERFQETSYNHQPFRS